MASPQNEHIVMAENKKRKQEENEIVDPDTNKPLSSAKKQE